MDFDYSLAKKMSTLRTEGGDWTMPKNTILNINLENKLCCSMTQLYQKTSSCTTQTLSVVDDVDVDPEVFGEWGEKIAAEKGSIRSSSSQLEGQGAWKREELLVRQQRRHRHGLWVPVTKVCARRSTIYMHSNICRHTSASRTLIFMCGDFQTSSVWGGFC